MENFTYEGKEFEFWGKTGVVLSSEKRTETTAYQTNGQVKTIGNNTNITLPETKFESVLKHDFWIKKEDDTEESIHLSGIDIPLRSGQKVTVIYVAEKGKSGCKSVLVNHSADKFWFINNAWGVIDNLNIFSFFGKSLLIAIIAGIGIGFPGALIFDLRGGSIIAFSGWIAAGVFAYRLFVGQRRRLKFQKLLDTHLVSLARNTLQKT